MDVRMSLSKTSSEQEVWLHDPDCVRNVFLCTFQCVWCYLTCENGKIRVIWQTDGSAVMVEADNGSSCCVWGFPPHSSSWMFPLTSDLSTVWSDTSFHRMIAETFSSVPGATADASAVGISRRREKKTRTYSVQNDETDGIFPCEQVHHLPFYSRGGDELYILWMLLCFWEDESAIQVMLSCGPPGSRPVWQTHAHITPTGTRPGAVSSKGHFQNTAVWCIFLNSKI